VAPQLAKFIGKASGMTFSFVMTPLSFGPQSISEKAAAEKNLESQKLITNVISSMLFFFMMNNQIEVKFQSLDMLPTPAPKDKTDVIKQ
jgi:hypothetical protein